MAVADFPMKQHDRLPSIQATLFDPFGTPIDLTGCSVQFNMAVTSGGTPILMGVATIVSPATDGVVRYDWAAIDTAVAGNYLGEWQVTFPSGKKQSYPTLSFHTIAILADLDGA